jgi:hypothetical protein
MGGGKSYLFKCLTGRSQEYIVNSSTTYPKPRFLAVVVGLMGFLLLWEGWLQIMAGGSFYYVLAGIVLAACCYL